VTWDDLRVIVSALPGTAEGTSYGTPSFRVGKAFLTRLREDGETLVVPLAGLDERDALIEGAPEVYFTTDHYRDWPSVLVRLPAAGPEHVAGLLTQAWRRRAGKRTLAAYDAGRAA
jgi:hypothetical protein